MIINDKTSKGVSIRLGDAWDDEGLDMHLSGEQYRVYVNSTYVGDKMCTNNQGIRTISNFLQSLGFSNYTITYDGNDIKIKTTDNDLAEKLKNYLQEDLNSR